jgi:CHAT domain-containing protein
VIVKFYDPYHFATPNRPFKLSRPVSTNLDTAVLSACETALGTEVRSEGLVGMSSTMLARGARAVVASLWTVPDEIGARLMTEFYRHMLHDSMGPEAALGTVMRSMALRDRSADPALWAAFQVSVAALGPDGELESEGH